MTEAPAILPMRYYGDPVLETPTEPVSEITDELRVQVAQMIEAMYYYGGVGLAANQLGFTNRVFVYDNGDGRGARVVINPVVDIDPLYLDEAPEGCLSVPQFGWKIPRSYVAVLDGIDLDGNPVHVETEWLTARIFQHEVDHLDGKLLLSCLPKDEVDYFKVTWETHKP
jgi:peptide deformylase